MEEMYSEASTTINLKPQCAIKRMFEKVENELNNDELCSIGLILIRALHRQEKGKEKEDNYE